MESSVSTPPNTRCSVLNKIVQRIPSFYQESKDPSFLLSNGSMSKHYVNCRDLLSTPWAAAGVVELLKSKVTHGNQICGVPQGATPWAAC